MNGNDPTIQPNSPYDQTLKFDSSSSGELGQYSPRPDPNDTGLQFQNYGSTGNGNNPLAGFELKFNGDTPGSSSTGFENYNTMDNYSPRPDHTDYNTSSPELAQLFSLISQFEPTPIDISPHFKPFLPELVPAIGAIDAFIKIPRPDDEQDPLGLTVLDEPTIGCSDPQILKMQLREKYGIVDSSNEGDGYIGCIKDLEHNQKALDTFLESYEEIDTKRPAPTMVYTHAMPELTQINEQWPEELEKLLDTVPLPSADLDLTLEEYAKIICAILDIPVKGNMVESLHLLFTLYQHFRDNVHFNTSRGSTPVNPPRQ